ncbi:hypothetical protein IW136_004210, partial [Coemansia sp. RSA 678]
ASGVIFVHGSETIIHPNSDTKYEFHQDSNFYYLSRVHEPGFAATYNIALEMAILFVNHVSDDKAVWIGVPPSLDTYCIAHGVDQAHYTFDVEKVLSALKPSTVYMLKYTNTEQLGALLASIINHRTLLDPLHEARVFKDKFDIDVMRRANCQVCGRFVGLVLSKNSMYKAYGSIAACGHIAAGLHYAKNNQLLENADEMILVDAGATFENYASDITHTWTVGLTFLPLCRDIYEIVLDMQKQVIQACGPNKQWEDMHNPANSVAAQGLIKLGILHGLIKAILDNFVVGYFMPHGIGHLIGTAHLIGIDTHDVGGYPTGTERVNEPGLWYLHACREMMFNMMFTVEPGLYFVNNMLSGANSLPEIAQYIDFDKVAEYRCVGGIQIEDNIIITESGYDNLMACSKDVDELESIRAIAYKQ